MRKSPRADLEVKVVSVTGGKALPYSSEWCIPDLRVGCVATVEPGGLFVVRDAGISPRADSEVIK